MTAGVCDRVHAARRIAFQLRVAGAPRLGAHQESRPARLVSCRRRSGIPSSTSRWATAGQLVGFVHESTEGGIDISWLDQPEMETVAEGPEGFGSAKARVGHPPTEPEAGIKVSGTYDGAREAHAGLEHDPGLLGIDGDGSTGSGERCPGPIGRVEGGGRATEMGAEGYPDARMPEVPGDEAMPTLRASPKRLRPRGGHGEDSVSLNWPAFYHRAHGVVSFMRW
jgi:hypothetical protein